MPFVLVAAAPLVPTAANVDPFHTIAFPLLVLHDVPVNAVDLVNPGALGPELVAVCPESPIAVYKFDPFHAIELILPVQPDIVDPAAFQLSPSVLES